MHGKGLLARDNPTKYVPKKVVHSKFSFAWNGLYEFGDDDDCTYATNNVSANPAKCLMARLHSNSIYFDVDSDDDDARAKLVVLLIMRPYT